MSNDKWVATVMAFYSKSGKLNIQISSYYVQEYAESSCKDKNFALNFDRDGAYFYADGDVELAAASTYNMPSLSSIKEYPDMAVQSTANLRPQHVLTVVRDNIVSTQSDERDPFETYHYLNVPMIKQAEKSFQCWAACIASARGFYGTPTTIDNVYNVSGVEKYAPGDVDIVSYTLKIYGFEDKWYWQDSISWYELISEILLNRPFYVECRYGVTSDDSVIGHAVFLRGYLVYRNVSQLGAISYMDPATGTYVASSVSDENEYYYVPSDKTGPYETRAFIEIMKK